METPTSVPASLQPLQASEPHLDLLIGDSTSSIPAFGPAPKHPQKGIRPSPMGVAGNGPKEVDLLGSLATAKEAATAFLPALLDGQVGNGSDSNAIPSTLPLGCSGPDILPPTS